MIMIEDNKTLGDYYIVNDIVTICLQQFVILQLQSTESRPYCEKFIRRLPMCAGVIITIAYMLFNSVRHDILNVNQR